MDKQDFVKLAAALPTREFTDAQMGVILGAVSDATEVDDFCQRSQESWHHFGKEGAVLLPVVTLQENPEYAWNGWTLSLLSYRRNDGKIFRGIALSIFEEDGGEYHHFLEEVEDSNWCAVLHCAPDTAHTRQFAANAGALLPGVSPDADLPLSLLTRW